MEPTSLVFDFSSPDEISDSISTSAASLNYLPFEEVSPENIDSKDSIGDDERCNSKKIRKKRNAYHKIDDDIRLGLLEAVQRGETLKSAAKRYQVNYSSAKSIFHIYRKEGRILKKATTEKPFGFPNQDQQFDYAVRSHLLSDNSSYIVKNYSSFRPVHQDLHPPVSNMDATGCPSPLNELADNFVDLLKLGNTMKPKEDILRPQSYTPTNSGLFHPKIIQREEPIHKMVPFYQMTLASNPTAALISPSKEKMKQFGDFYMNYSNSPLSGKNRMVMEGSECGSNRYVQGEFDSFSEMVNAFQGKNHLTENLKSPASRFLITSTPKNTLTNKTLTDEELILNNLENPVLESFKSFVDMQMGMSNPFKNFTHQNILLQKPLVDESPNFSSFKCN